MTTKQTIVRWPEDMAANAKLVSDIDGVPVNTLICSAVATYITERRSAPEFRDRLRQRIESDQQLLRSLDGEQ